VSPAGQATKQASAARRAANVLPVIVSYSKAGFASHNAIAGALNRRGVKTARGGNTAASSSMLLGTEYDRIGLTSG
jgi:hypothetical protein